MFGAVAVLAVSFTFPQDETSRPAVGPTVGPGGVHRGDYIIFKQRYYATSEDPSPKYDRTGMVLGWTEGLGMIEVLR